MPQMAPMSWTYMMIYVVSLFMGTLCWFHFAPICNLKLMSGKSLTNSFSWGW
uniref:ATP synthase F0 subunit 8 n=1 Tax=Pleurocryptella fimbriata TaxID=2480055 RepID=A0A8K1Y3J8_9CRUS|nr:ATP synthase F0 subunit 8 [Pleurocryptella fimbriata]